MRRRGNEGRVPHTEETGFMRNLIGMVLAVALSIAGQQAHGQILGRRGELERVNCAIHGQVLDFTRNHGKDCRIWSNALGQKRDLYVYVPPGYDPAKKYPLIVYLHGALQDEGYFLKNIVKRIDAAASAGELPACIVAAPDGSILGRPALTQVASFFANADAGRFEDYLMVDVWDFVINNFSIRPEREAHALVGMSMGGSAAFAHAIRHKDKVKIAIGFMPSLNLRWVDCHGRYQGSFDPECWGWREKLRPFEVIGRLQGITVRTTTLSHSLIGHGPDAISKMSQHNPIELLDRYGLKEGELDLYVAYGGKDELNITAQVDSFLYRARERGLTVSVDFDPQGRHDAETAWQFLPAAIRWIAPRLAPYSPGPDTGK
jgi:enterochelin esterase-like enzyme